MTHAFSACTYIVQLNSAATGACVDRQRLACTPFAFLCANREDIELFPLLSSPFLSRCLYLWSLLADSHARIDSTCAWPVLPLPQVLHPKQHCCTGTPAARSKKEIGLCVCALLVSGWTATLTGRRL